MEAQYGLQKKKPLIPLLMQEGYEADGWLGLLLGTSVWYALYGATLATESAFDDRMGALSREIGTRGRADALVVDELEPGPATDSASDPLREELSALRLKDLRRRARAEGVAAEQLEEAADADDPKAACVELLLALHADASDDGIAELRAELEGMRLKELRRRARAQGVGADELEEAAESDEPKAAMVELLLSKAA